MIKYIGQKYVYFIPGLFLAALLGCSSSTDSGSDKNDENQDKSQQYSLSTNISPSDAGSVDPASGTFEEGSSVTIEAEANTYWKFTEWSGAIDSKENPLTFTINKDTELTASFLATGSDYEIELTLEDQSNSVSLKFGQINNATANYDDNIDKESPPAPPAGVLYGYFSSTNRDFLWDFRAIESDSVSWTLQYQVGEGDSLNLSWKITDTALNGSLSLTDANDSFDIDMTSEQSHSIAKTDADSLLINYRLGD